MVNKCDKCDKCGQIITNRGFLDAIGKEFDIHSVLLYMKPIDKVTIGDGTLTFNEPIASEPVVVFQSQIDYDAFRNEYTLQTHTTGKWLHDENRLVQEYYEITGSHCVRNPRVYKLANSFKDMP